MEKDLLRTNNNVSGDNTHKTGGGYELTRSSGVSQSSKQTTSDFVLQWGNRKRLRCTKVQSKDDSSPAIHRTTVRVVRADKDLTTSAAIRSITNSNGYFNLRHRPSSPQPPPSHRRLLRNSENKSAMRGQSNRGLTSPERGAHDRRATSNGQHQEISNKSGASSETAHDSKKGGSSSGGSGQAAVWPPKFMIALTNKEKEEDFIAFKGSKPPQRPKKRAKFIQRTVNLVSPGAWLCDLTLERYEVREKKMTKKLQKPRGLKAMGNMESDSE